MDEFMPSQRILEEICSDLTPIRQYFYIPTALSKRKMEETCRGITCAVSNQIAEYYKWGVDIIENMETQKMVLIFDALLNSIFHGSKNVDPVSYGLFIGDKGVCHGFRDSGDYFKSEEIKRLFENKIPLTEFGIAEPGISGHSYGVRGYIYGYSDFIEVDTSKGVLYCVQLKKSLDRKNS